MLQELISGLLITENDKGISSNIRKLNKKPLLQATQYKNYAQQKQIETFERERNCNAKYFDISILFYIISFSM